MRPAQHYSMGGVRTDYRGESPTLRGLFACGEAACWDMHGFNRLGGNSVAETVVAGMIVGEYVADFCDDAANDIQISGGLIREFWRREDSALDALIDARGDEQAPALCGRMKDIMTDKVGIFRSGDDLQWAVDELQKLLLRSRNIGIRDKTRAANPELVAAYRVRRMLKLALCVAYGALQRTESRGAHYRQDYPRRDDENWLNRTLATWQTPDDTVPTLAYEALDVMQMEMPPGWRGYGPKDHIDHPQTAVRQQEIEGLRRQMQDAGRRDLQTALMPFRHLLPPTLRGLNGRLRETK